MSLTPASGQDLSHRFAARAQEMTASEIRALFAVATRPEVVSLAGGMPNLTDLPMDVVADVVGKVARDLGSIALQYGSGQGIPVLREQITEIMALEAINAHHDDVLVTTGSQQALDLVARLFLDPGDVVLCEAPSYVGALGTFKQYQAGIIHIAMDEHGMIPQALREAIATTRAAGRTIKFLYLIPNFQNPAGVTLSAARRTEILQIAEQAEILVLEDNPYGLLGFDGKVRPAMRAEDDQNVIYLGSFSKTFAPGFRVGWLVAPPSLREKLVIASESTILCPSNFSQLAISTYFAEHDWKAQIASFRGLYQRRRDAMISAMAEKMPSGTTWTYPDGGFYVWVTLPQGIDAKAMLPKAVEVGVAYVPGTAFYADGLGAWSLRLAYCYPTPERIKEGIDRLAGVLEGEVTALR